MKGYKICPAYAGMIPGDIGKISEAMNLSRVCGDDPIFYILKCSS